MMVLGHDLVTWIATSDSGCVYLFIYLFIFT